MAAGSLAKSPDGVLAAVDVLLLLPHPAATVSNARMTSGFRKPSMTKLLTESSTSIRRPTVRKE
jgi:hypothetical protein